MTASRLPRAIRAQPGAPLRAAPQPPPQPEPRPVTPPLGVVLFVTARVANVPFGRLARATIPYIWALLAVLIAITLWPPLTTFLPNLLLGK